MTTSACVPCHIALLASRFILTSHYGTICRHRAACSAARRGRRTQWRSCCCRGANERGGEEGSIGHPERRLHGQAAAAPAAQAGAPGAHVCRCAAAPADTHSPGTHLPQPAALGSSLAASQLLCLVSMDICMAHPVMHFASLPSPAQWGARGLSLDEAFSRQCCRPVAQAWWPRIWPRSARAAAPGSTGASSCPSSQSSWPSPWRCARYFLSLPFSTLLPPWPFSHGACSPPHVKRSMACTPRTLLQTARALYQVAA